MSSIKNLGQPFGSASQKTPVMQTAASSSPKPPRMTAAKGRPTRILTAAQRRRRRKRQALGITDLRNATAAQIKTARSSGLLPASARRRKPTRVTTPGRTYTA